MIYTVAQQKGGVGKTTSAINVAALLAMRGRRVLAVDADPQFALTRQLGVRVSELPLTLVDVLTGHVEAADSVLTDVHGVDLLPAHRQLSSVEVTLAGEIGRETFLRRALDPLVESYDDVVIDTPPNLGLLTVNALLLADIVLAPVSAEDEGSAQGLAELNATFAKLEDLRGGSQPKLIVLLTRWQEGRLMAQAVENAIAGRGFAIPARIPARAAVQQAAAWRTPLVFAVPESPASGAYAAFVDELLAVKAVR
jgi:chromosome partitioning protein